MTGGVRRSERVISRGEQAECLASARLSIASALCRLHRPRRSVDSSRRGPAQQRRNAVVQCPTLRFAMSHPFVFCFRRRAGATGPHPALSSDVSCIKAFMPLQAPACQVRSSCLGTLSISSHRVSFSFENQQHACSRSVDLVQADTTGGDVPDNLEGRRQMVRHVIDLCASAEVNTACTFATLVRVSGIHSCQDMACRSKFVSVRAGISSSRQPAITDGNEVA